MKRDLDKIMDDYISKSDYRDLIVETDEIIKDSPETIISFIDILNKKDVKSEWERNQIREVFISSLLKLEEDIQIRITYEIVRKFFAQINIKEIADKLCFFVSGDKLLNHIIETLEEQQLKQFNRLLVHGLLLRGKFFSEEEKKAIFNGLSDFETNWVGLELDEVERGLPLRSYSLNGGILGISFGLQSAEKFPYLLPGFSSLKLNTNTNQELNDLSSTIAKEYIRLIEIGDFEYAEEEVHDLEAGIICQLNYAENLSESTKIAFKGISDRDVFSYLFNMSVLGGAYKKGDYGATSRINTWKAICGLIQKNFYKSNKKEAINELSQFRWTEFSCEDAWFINDWIDLGIIGINQNQKKYAVLVISDTD
jgi:Family of unknown function (DUF6183)